MTTLKIILCILGALACAGWAIWIVTRPKDHETEGCIQKPRGFWGKSRQQKAESRNPDSARSAQL